MFTNNDEDVLGGYDLITENVERAKGGRVWGPLKGYVPNHTHNYLVKT